MRDHRVYEGKVSVGEAGRLSIQTTNGSVQEVALDQVRIARLKATPGASSGLPSAWHAEDLGQVQGSSSQKESVFALRVSGGTLKDPKQQAVHFVSRLLRGEGQLTARMLGVSGPAPCVAGVMMRENLEPPGGFVLLAVTPDQKLRLLSRDAGWSQLKQRDLGAITFPIWLKLVREEKEKRVTAFRSADGTNWQQAGQSPLNCKVEPFPEGSDTWRPKLYAGLAITGAGTEAAASARFDQVVLMARGLLGEYFADDRFRNRRFARPDGKIEFYWGQGSPAPDIPEDHFSVRWTGQVQPKFSENYRFYVDADNDAWLWVNGQELPAVKFNRKEAKEVPLKSDRKYDLKLEFKEGAGAASVRLGWSSRSQPLEVIPPSQLSYTYHPGSPDEEAERATTTNAFFVKGLWLRNGSFIAGPIRSADDVVTRIPFAGRTDFPISSIKVALAVFRPPRRAIPFDAARDRTGVFLKNGDFLDSEFKRLDGRALTVGSVLFGQRTFSLDNGDVIALVLHPCLPLPAPFELRLLNGSVLRIKSLRAAGTSVLAEDTTLGEVAIPEKELLEIRNTGSGAGGRVANQP